MPSAIERYWRTADEKSVSWVDHRKEIEVNEITLAEICGVAKEEIKAYIDRLETETSYRLKRDWVTQGRMTRKERIIGDQEILLVALAIGKVRLMKGRKENEIIIESSSGDKRVVTKIHIAADALTEFIESLTKR